jgi:hypothetical protein
MTIPVRSNTLLAIQKQLEEDNMNDYAISLSLQDGFSTATRSSVNHLGEAVTLGRMQFDALTGSPSGEPRLNFVGEAEEVCATNPSHYKNADKKYEHRFVAKAWNLEYYLSAATKYIARCGKKPSVGMTTTEKEIQDLEKAIVYIQFRIEELQGE